ncbi:hypothetical protein, partial [Pontiella sp.]|uniref:hypothetical protein n=1 Tax=Pontiella sp. TaxID=2837462 RepID=UPI003568C62C
GCADAPYTVGLDSGGQPQRAFGPGLALLPNADVLDPTTDGPDISYVTVVENNDPSMGGSPITPYIIKVDRTQRYRGSIKTVLSDNVFDENVVLRHQGDFGANADDLFFEWWYRPDDGSLDVPPPDDAYFDTHTNPWKLFPDLSGELGRARYEATLKGNPNAPEALLADTWWFCRYRHANDVTGGTDWPGTVDYTWAGAGNSDPLGVYNDGIPDYQAQLVMGWIKRVLDAVNPYEARISDFDGDSPATVASMLAQFGARYEGPVALNPDKDVIENVGLIELYETILKRGRDLSIDLSRPISTPAIANALQLAATRIADFYMLLANEAYTDAIDPTIGVDDGSLSSSVFSFQNQLSSLIEEELCLLRGVDDNFARPVYNRLFWNFTKGEGEAAYAINYNISDVNADGFINEDDAMAMFPQGHGDAWGHYLTALRNQYELLNHAYFNWVSRSEYYNLMDVVMKVDFLDERKFAQMAAAKAKAGAEIVDLTYREKYVEDPEAQWQGYTDSDEQRAWGVQGWARRAAQGAYFDWVTANALLPAEHPNETLEGIQKVDRQSNADIAVVSANLNAIQRTFDHANDGYNPLGLSKDVMVFDIDPTSIDSGQMHFDQLYDRAIAALANVQTAWDKANESANRLREVGNTEAEYRNAVFQEDLSYRNRLIEIFGKPYAGTVGSGKLYAAGYDGPDLSLHMYVDVNGINNNTVPGPSLDFATFNAQGTLTSGAMYDAFNTEDGLTDLDASDLEDYWALYAPSLVVESGTIPAKTEDGLYNVDFNDLVSGADSNPDGIETIMPVTTSGYSFVAPDDWGERPATGTLQSQLAAMLRQETAVYEAIDAWNSHADLIIRTFKLLDAKIQSADDVYGKNAWFSRVKYVTENVIKGLEGARAINEAVKDSVEVTYEAAAESIPQNLPTGGFSISPGDALAPVRGGIELTEVAITYGINSYEAGLRIAQLVANIGLDVWQSELELFEKREATRIDKAEWLMEAENLIGDEPMKRVAIFKEIEALRSMGDEYRSLLDEGARLVDERAAFNKRVAAATQRSRYQDMTFRVARNHALRNYRAAVDLAARYAYLAARAYDYETNFADDDPGNPAELMTQIIRARGLELADSLNWLKTNWDAVAPQLGINNPQLETGKMSLRTECFRILPKGGANGSDDLWVQTLEEAWVDDLWQVPEFEQYCRAFASEFDTDGEGVAQPGLVFRFPTTITAGQNVFGKPLGGGDHAYDPSVYSTKIRAAGIWFSDYQSDDMAEGDLPEAPRVYLFPSGTDVMRVPTDVSTEELSYWSVVDQRIPVPIPALSSDLDYCDWTPLSSSLNGRFGEARRFSSFRAYHDGGDLINDDELVYNSRLVGRSVWNTEWVLIIPGITLNADPDEGLRRFIDQVTDIKLVFETYGYSGN